MNRILLFIFLLFFTAINAQQTQIKINISNCTDSIAILGYYYGNEKYIEDTTSINLKGDAVFSKRFKYTGGMYFIALPQSKNIFFSFLIGNNQTFTINAEVKENSFTNIKYKNSPLNIEFENFNAGINDINNNYRKLSTKYRKKETTEDEKIIIKDSLKLLVKSRKEFIKNKYETEKYSTLKTILGLIIEPEVPDVKIDKSVNNKDSLRQMKNYFYYKDHYWDYVDLNDSIIIRTPFFIPKFEKYISEIIIQNPDTLSYESIKIIEKARGNIAVFAYLVNYMLTYNEKEQLMGMDKIFVEIGKKYYLTGEAIWADSAYTAKVIEKVLKTEPNLIGEKAPAINNVSSIDNKIINMYDIDAEYLVIIFWEPSCGHCKTELPKLYNIYNELKDKGIDIEVLSMLGDRDTVKWEKFIKEKGLTDWINVWDSQWTTNFKNFYNIYSTPVIYVLDKNKKIIAKRITSEQVKTFIEGKEQ